MKPAACEAWLEAISAYLDGSLTSEEERAVQAHLHHCGACADMLIDWVPMIQALRALPEPTPQRDLWQAIAEELRHEPPAPRRLRLPEQLSRHWPGVAVAASVLILLWSGGLAWLSDGVWGPPVPVADLDTYWHQHDAFDLEESLTSRFGPAVDTVEASYGLDP